MSLALIRLLTLLICEEGGQFLGHRPVVDNVVQPYEWMSYTRAQERVTHFGAGLAQLGLTKDSNFGIFSINRSEWVSDRD